MQERKGEKLQVSSLKLQVSSWRSRETAGRAKVRCGANRYENYECYEYWAGRALHVMTRDHRISALRSLAEGPVSAIL